MNIMFVVLYTKRSDHGMASTPNFNTTTYLKLGFTKSQNYAEIND